jgi:hypothetical protein
MVKQLALDQQLHQMAVAMQEFIIHGYFNSLNCQDLKKYCEI